MATAGHRTRTYQAQDITDDWLIAAARRAGHAIPRGAPASGVSAWRTLLAAGLTDEIILSIACADSGAEPADLSRASPSLAGLLPNQVALEHRVAPVGLHRGALAIATVNPKSAELERVLAFACKQRVELQAASPSAILRAQGVIYGTGSFGTNVKLDAVAAPPPPVVQPRPAPVGRLSVTTTMPDDAHVATADDTRAGRQGESTSGPTNSPASLVDRLLSSAVSEHASEAHLDPVPDGGIIVRMRVDGKLNDRFRATDVNAARLIHGLKSIAGLNPEETRRPQNGRASFTTQQGSVNIRLWSEPVGVSHERVIVKLYTSQAIRPMSDLGLSPVELHRIAELLKITNGVILVAGPPSSGKTTTLYAMLREVQRRGRKVATIEETVTFPLEGVDQTEVSAHLTRAAALRATFALGADAVLADVPSDPETTEMIVADKDQPRLTLASLNAPDFPAAIARLYELDLDPATLTASLKGIISQRLVRRLCPACAVTQQVSELPESQQALVFGLPTDKLRRPVGCEQCRGTGYSGRMVVAEIAHCSPALLAAIARRANMDELTRVARDEGVTLLWDAGLHLVLQGVTTLGELLDSVPPPAPADASTAEQSDIDALLKQLLGSQAMTSAPPAPAAREPEASKPVAEPAMRVLLVDDDVAARRTLATELRNLGVQITEASDGEAALAYAQRLRPDVVVTEVALPKLDGIGLVQALAAAGAKPRIIVYTSQDDAALHSWLREAGAGDVLPRETPVATLLQRMRG